MVQTSHTRLARGLHWGFIGLYLYGLSKQLDDLSQLEDPGLLAFEVVFAILFLAIVVARYAYMRRFQTLLGARETMHPDRRRLARAVHLSMYLCMAMLPLSGLMIAGLYSLGLEDGLLQDAAVELHEFCASLSYVLIALHVAAAISSRLKREGIWSAMVPVWKEDTGDREREDPGPPQA